jgi:hypothetical protein
VYGGRISSLPIFCYHQIDDTFEDDLRFLAAAGYRTLGAADLEAIGRGDSSHDATSVVLTFDDGHASLARVGVPLLRKYGFRALAFVVSGYVPSSSSRELAGWDDLRRGVALQVLDVGSHSRYHDQLPVSPRVVGVVDPCTDKAFHANIPIPRTDAGNPRVGRPVLEGRPRYVAFRAFKPEPKSVDAFTEAAFLIADGWRNSGHGRYLCLSDFPPITGTYLEARECETAIVEDMARAAAIVEQQCPNPAQRHLCYPWFAGVERTDRLAKVAGIECVYKGVNAPSHKVETDVLPARFGRLPPDLLWRLPGPKRKSMASIVCGRLGLRERSG